MKKILPFLFVFLTSISFGATAKVQVDTKTHAMSIDDGSTVIDAKGITLTLGGFTISDASGVKKIVTGSSSGAMFGDTGNKISFLGATPIVRPAATLDLRQALINLGLYTTGGATPLNLNGGTATAANFKGSINGAINLKDDCNGTCTPAVGNGVTDDSTAINQHIAYAAGLNRILYAPEGTYKTNAATLRFVAANGAYCKGLIGEGTGTVFTTTANGPIITVDTIGGRMDFVEFSGFVLRNTGPLTNTVDSGILFCDTAGTPTAQNRINKFSIHDISFLSCSYAIRSTRNPVDGEGEIGFDGNQFYSLKNEAVNNDDQPTAHSKVPVYFIKLDNGSGTGNSYSGLTGGTSEAFFSVGTAGGGNNVGDIVISNFQMSGVSGGHAKGIEIIGGTAYNANIAISSIQADGGIVKALDVSGVNNISVSSANYGGGVLVNFTDCDYIKLETNSYPVTTLTACGPHNQLIGSGTETLGQWLVVPQITTGEPWMGDATHALAIGTTAKNVAPTGGQNAILFQSGDVANPLQASFALGTGSSANDRNFSVSVLEQNVGWKPFVIGGGSGLAIGSGTYPNPGEGVASLQGVLFRPIASPPATPTEGLCYQSSIDHHFYIYNGTTWKQIDN